jgi:hypothetical protein
MELTSRFLTFASLGLLLEGGQEIHFHYLSLLGS